MRHRTRYTQADIDLFEVGTEVVVTRDDGTREIRKVRIPPWQLGSGDWVVGLTGISGGYSLERCVIPEPGDPTPCDP